MPTSAIYQQGDLEINSLIWCLVLLYRTSVPTKWLDVWLSTPCRTYIAQKCSTDATSFYHYFSYQYCYHPLCPPQCHGNCIPPLGTICPSPFLSLTKLLLLDVNSSQCCQVSLRLLRKILRCTGELGCLLVNLPQAEKQPAFPKLSCPGSQPCLYMALRTPWNLSLPDWHYLSTIPQRALGNPPQTAQPPNRGKFNS